VQGATTKDKSVYNERPFWVFSEERWERIFTRAHELVHTWDVGEAASAQDVRFAYKGYLLRRPTPCLRQSTLLPSLSGGPE
jgi:hypothetical protein